VPVARPQGAAFQIAELVEQKQRMVAGAAEVAVVGRAFLVAVGRADRAVHIAEDGFRRLVSVHPIDPAPGQITRAARLSSPANSSVSKRPIWLAEAPPRSAALPPTIQQIAGRRR
jgi:heme A synthase